jgi:titin
MAFMMGKYRVSFLRVRRHPAALITGIFLAALAAPHATAVTLIVSNISPSGPGSLQQAILDANSTNGLDTIVFQIPGTGVHTISPTNALPPITDPVVIDATTQPGFAGTPLIELNGVNAGNSAALRLLAGNSTIQGLAIYRFAAQGLLVQAGGTNLIQGNFIGTDSSGALARGNGLQGIWINGSSGNFIGGTSATSRNLISGNGDAGVYLLNSQNNTIQGNLIGTTASGTAALGNANNGIYLINAPGNIVGGPAPAARNVISGNGGSGIYLNGSGTTGNLVRGNYIGTDTNGSLALPNVVDGVTVNGAPGNTIGGAIAGAGNLISGNSQGGVSLNGAGAANNLVQGNCIGTDASGRLVLGNLFSGVTIFGGNSNLIGGTVSAARNVLSGNKLSGVYITTNSTGNLVQGNFIGVDGTGSNALGNSVNGISLDSASFNTIGGTTSGARNIISGNASDGIQVYNATATANSIQGNFIGTTAGGTIGLGNGRAGIGISGAPGNLIGGTTAGAGNLLSANGDAAIYLTTSGATRNLIQGNTIGTDLTGTQPLGNTYEGLYVERAPTNTIGGAVPGAGNLISANHTRGIWLTNASWNVIQGNLIGTKQDGISALGNTFHSVECEVGACNNTIGGAGSAGNVIAFAQTVYAGVRIRDGSTNNAILGNAIFSNGALGIDLGTNGVNGNSPCDTASGANMAQNYPILSQAVSGNGIGIRGTLNSRPNQSFLLQFFANPTCDSSGYGEGQIYLGQQTVVTSNNCNANFVVALPNQVPVGYVITATATDSANNTSEFSACIPVTSVPALKIAPATNHQATLAWTNTTTGFVLKQTSSLSPPIQWTPVTNNPVVSNGQFVVTFPVGTTNRFYVLHFE